MARQGSNSNSVFVPVSAFSLGVWRGEKATRSDGTPRRELEFEFEFELY